MSLVPEPTDLLLDQHRLIIQRVNGLYGIFFIERPDPSFAADLQMLVETLVRHFADERNLMRSLGYAEEDAHATEHDAILSDAAAARAAFDGEDRTERRGALARFLDRIMAHHAEEDGRFDRFVQARTGARLF